MPRHAIFFIGALALAACGSNGGGQGFDPYEVTPSGQTTTVRTETEMLALPAVPRHVVTEAPTAPVAASVRPYRSAPEASVAAVSTENTWLRVVDAGDIVWLVAEATSGRAPDAAMLRSEAVQRSGCLVAGSPGRVGRSTVFRLDCS